MAEENTQDIHSPQQGLGEVNPQTPMDPSNTPENVPGTPPPFYFQPSEGPPGIEGAENTGPTRPDQGSLENLSMNLSPAFDAAADPNQ